MSCAACVFWDGNYDSQRANCTRYPVWQETSGMHFCGEFKAELGWGYKESRRPKHISQYNAMVIANKESTEYAKRNKKLRVENKELREMYKKETGKLARVNPARDSDNA